MLPTLHELAAAALSVLIFWRLGFIRRALMIRPPTTEDYRDMESFTLIAPIYKVDGTAECYDVTAAGDDVILGTVARFDGLGTNPWLAIGGFSRRDTYHPTLFEAANALKQTS